MSTLANQLAVAERDEVGRGIRLLLATPLLTERESPEAFDLVRRRRDPVTKWFEYYCGWSLVVEPRLGYARLAKVRRVPAAADGAGRPARRRRSGRSPFDRRRYTLLCVVAAELLTLPVTTVGLLADRVAQATAADPVVPGLDTASRAERMALVDAIRLLESFGVVDAVDGATESYVGSAQARVLYRVDTALLLRLLAAPVGVSGLAVPAEEVPTRFDELLTRITTERRYGAAGEDRAPPDASRDDVPGVPVSPAQRNLWLRHSIFRRLVDDPVVHLAELSADEVAYLASPTGRQLVRRAADQGGFVLEERADGLLLVDPDGIATDTRFPDDSSTAKVAALLLLDTLTAAAEPLAREHLRGEAEHWQQRFPRWARAYEGADGRSRLVADALAVLVGFDLVTDGGGLVRPRPAAFRYRLAGVRAGRDADRASDHGPDLGDDQEEPT
jgi:uncharacterized protein (TIGR02678 family)